MQFIEKPSYDYKSFLPFLKEDLIKVHYEQHHMKYMKNIELMMLNTKEEMNSIIPMDFSMCTLDQFIMYLRDIIYVHPRDVYKFLLNNALQVANHNLFWKSMHPQNNNIFTENNALIKDFKENCKRLFGSGWVWVCKYKDQIKIVSTKDAERPEFCERLLVIDLWEHAYYLQFCSSRAEFVDIFLKFANWP